jgi:hypothetical protein
MGIILLPAGCCDEDEIRFNKYLHKYSVQFSPGTVDSINGNWLREEKHGPRALVEGGGG